MIKLNAIRKKWKELDKTQQGNVLQRKSEKEETSLKAFVETVTITTPIRGY